MKINQTKCVCVCGGGCLRGAGKRRVGGSEGERSREEI